ncbi:MAG: hypothetical protein QM724_08620 [Flavobacteriales bacterium]
MSRHRKQQLSGIAHSWSRLRLKAAVTRFDKLTVTKESAKERII